MFDNIGRTLKGAGRVVCYVGIVLSIIGMIGVWITGIGGLGGFSTFLLGLLLGVLGCLGSWVTGLCAYGFGQMVEDVEALRRTVDDMGNPMG